jgi:hypothetical protein
MPMSGGFIPDEDLPQGGRKITRRGKKTIRITAKRILDRGAPRKRQSIRGPGINKMKKGKTARRHRIRKYSY